MGITIKEIAKLAGVHRATVDKVLHDRTGVSPEVREKIKKIIKEYDYKINPIGKALKMQDKTLHIGVILLAVDALESLKEGIERELKQYLSFHIELEYKILPYHLVGEQSRAIREFAGQGIDGLILKALNAKGIRDALVLCQEKNIPVVTLNNDISKCSRLCYVGQDGYKAGKTAGRLMGEFLQGKGKVAVVTSDEKGQQYFPFGNREDGFKEIMTADYPGIHLLPSIYTEENPEIIEQVVADLFREQPVLAGIYLTCGGAGQIVGLMQKMERERTLFICFENYPEILAGIRDGVINVTLDSGLIKQGSKALQVLLDQVIYGKPPEQEFYYMDIHILIKENL